MFTYVISMSSLFRQLKGVTNAPGGLITTWATRQEKVLPIEGPIAMAVGSRDGALNRQSGCNETIEWRIVSFL